MEAELTFKLVPIPRRPSKSAMKYVGKADWEILLEEEKAGAIRKTVKSKDVPPKPDWPG